MSLKERHESMFNNFILDFKKLASQKFAPKLPNLRTRSHFPDRFLNSRTASDWSCLANPTLCGRESVVDVSLSICSSTSSTGLFGLHLRVEFLAVPSACSDAFSIACSRGKRRILNLNWITADPLLRNAVRNLLKHINARKVCVEPMKRQHTKTLEKARKKARGVEKETGTSVESRFASNLLSGLLTEVWVRALGSELLGNPEPNSFDRLSVKAFFLEEIMEAAGASCGCDS